MFNKDLKLEDLTVEISTSKGRCFNFGTTYCFVHADPVQQQINRVENSGILSDGKWHHVSVVRDNRSVGVYVDGFHPYGTRPKKVAMRMKKRWFKLFGAQ